MTRGVRFWLFAVGLGLLTSILVACGVQEIANPSGGLDQPVEHQTEVDFPLSVGNTWVYSGTFYQAGCF